MEAQSLTTDRLSLFQLCACSASTILRTHYYYRIPDRARARGHAPDDTTYSYNLFSWERLIYRRSRSPRAYSITGCSWSLFHTNRDPRPSLSFSNTLHIYITPIILLLSLRPSLVLYTIPLLPGFSRSAFPPDPDSLSSLLGFIPALLYFLQLPFYPGGLGFMETGWGRHPRNRPRCPVWIQDVALNVSDLTVHCRFGSSFPFGLGSGCYSGETG